MLELPLRSHLNEAIITTGASAVACAGIHLVVAPIWRKMIGRERYAALKRREKLYLAEKTVSTVNALVTGGLALYSITSGGYHGDVLHPYPAAAHYALGIFSGYSLYDTTVMALGAHEPPIMWLHHILGFGGAFAEMCFRELSFFPVAFAISELTVIPFNAIWYLSKFNVPRTSRVMRVALITRAVAFLAIRAPIGIFTMAYAHNQTKGGLPALLNRIYTGRETSRIFATGVFLNTMAFAIMNLIWTIQAIKASTKGRKKEE
ncbi:hypothetical protein FRC16_003841 [Serendipita sp. 398]|nr:hypothetical protein FRC16_003841 [Serendipita sp. 398]